MKSYVTQKFHKNFIRILSAITIAGMHLWWQGGPATVFSQSLEEISISLSLFDVKNEPVNGKYQVRFGLYSKDRAVPDAFPSNSDAGSRLWEETQEVEVRNGVIRTTLGNKAALPRELFSNIGDYYLGIRIGEDSEIVPRKKITSVPSALHANTARTLNGKTFGTNAGDIPALDAKGKIDIKLLPTGTGAKQLLLGSDGRLHDQNADIGTSSEVFNIGSGSSLSAANFDLTVSNAAAKAALRYNGATQSWQFSNDGAIFSDITSGAGSVGGIGVIGSIAYWTGTSTLGSEAYLAVSRGGTNTAILGSAGSIAYSTGSAYGFSSVGTAGQALISGGTGIPTWTTLGGGSITSDSLDFTELKDLLTLDASTDIAISGSNVLSLTNSGTGNSFLVNDQASDTTPFVIDASGNVGVGMSGPTQKLDVAGSINVSTGSAYRYDGTPVIIAQPSLNNYFFGNAGNLTMTGTDNAFVGKEAGQANITGSINSFLGYQAGYSNTTGSSNSFLGYQAGYSNTTGLDNSFLGRNAGFSNTTGNFNTFLGFNAGYSHTTGINNSFLGHSAGYSNTTGLENSFLGRSAGYFNSTGFSNSFFGTFAGFSNTTGSSNTALGYRAGYNASITLETNANSVFIGRDSNTSVNGLTNVIVLGYQAQATQSNQVVLGNASITQTLLRGNVGIGDTTPLSLFTVGNGDLFQVNASGAVASATGITSSGVITFSGLSVAGIVTNSAAGVLGTTTGTSGQLLVTNASNIPTFVTLSGDASLSNTGVLSLGIGSVVGANIASNTIEEIDLEVTNTPTGGFILSYDLTTGGFTWIANSGGTGSSKYTDNGTYTFLTDTLDDLVLGGSTIDTGFFFDVSASTLAFEGATANAFETTVGVVDPTADRSINFPNVSGTVITTGNLSGITATGTVTSGIWQGTTIAVANGGTGLTTLPTNGVLLGNGTSPLSSTSGIAGQFLVAGATNVPSFIDLSGDGTLSSAGVLTLTSSSVTGVEIADNTVEEVDFEVTNVPTDGYILSFNNATGGFTWVSPGAVGAGDITDVGSCTSGGCFIDGTNHTLTFDGSVIDAFETLLTVANPTADRTITLPDATGTVALLNAGQTFTSAIWNGSVVGTQYGGTGINGSAASNGRLLIGNGFGYTLATMTQGTGITITNGAGSITVSSTLGTDVTGAEIADNTIEEVDLEATNLPTQGYVLSYDSTTAGFTWISNTAGTGTSKWTDTGTLTYLTDIADDLAIGGTTGIASRFFFDVTTGNQIVFEGTGADDLNETTLVITNPTADRTITLPDATGTVALLNAGQTFTSAIWNGIGISVPYGGTGTTTFTSKGVLYGNGASAISATAAGTSGQLLLGVTAGNPGFATLSGDASITAGGILTLGTGVVTGVKMADNTIEEVDLEATNLPTQGYVLSYDSTTAGFTWISNTAGTGTSKWTDTGTLTYLTDIADDLAIGGTTGIASRFFFDVTTGNQIVFEGTGADDLNETTLVITNPTADRTITLPDATGTVLITGSSLLTLAGSAGSSQGIAQGDTITLAAGAGITTVGGATDTVTIASTLGVSVDLGTEVAGILPIASGGTGTTTFTSKGVLYGNGASAISATAAGTSGQLLLGVTAGNPGFATLSGDASITDIGILTIASNAVLLTADTVGNYVATITAGNGISGASTAEGGTATIALGTLTSDWSQSGAFDIILSNASSEIKILESSGATFFGAFDVGDLSSDQTYSFTTGGTVFTSGNDGSGSTLDADFLDGQDGSYYNNLANMTGVLAISKGGTNAMTIGAAGTIPYSDGASYAFQSAAGSAGQALISGGAASPTWYAPTIGSVLFGGISGALEQDNTNFFFDDTNNRLGLGTTVPSTRLDVTGLSLSTDASGTAGVANFTYSLTKNDTLSKTFPGLRIAPTINAGLSNTTTTLNVLALDTVNTATTGVTTNLIKASYGGVEQFTLASSGNVAATGQVSGADGLTTKVNAAACDDTVFATDTDGTICIDSLNGRIYYRYGGAWHYSAQTAGFQIPDYEAYSYDFDQRSFDEDRPLAEGDFLMPFVETPMQDGALHGLYAKFSDVKGTLFAEEHEKLARLSLATDQNVTTLGSLQASIDAELLSVSEALSDIEQASSQTNDRTTALDTRVFALEEGNARTLSSLASLETKMATLSDQNQALVEFFTTLDMKSVVMKDTDGNVDLLGGSIKARLLTTGGIVIENQDEGAPTIGTTTLYPQATDADQDGLDDFTRTPMEEAGGRDGKSVRVMTKAMIPMMKGSQIFTSFTGNPGGFSWVEKYVNEDGEYAGFDIRVSEAISTPIKIDWWLVERK